MRANVDYGPAVLPVGELLENKNSCLSNADTEKGAALLATMLTGAPAASHKNHMPEHRHNDAFVSVTTGEFLFDETRLHAQLEKAYQNLRRNEISEINIEVDPEILPETFLKIRKTTDGLHVDIESTSAETRHWLQGIRTRLSLQLHRKLCCPVEIAIIDGTILTHDVEQKNLANHARYL